jgi:hypothetical protein
VAGLRPSEIANCFYISLKQAVPRRWRGAITKPKQQIRSRANWQKANEGRLKQVSLEGIEAFYTKKD